MAYRVVVSGVSPYANQALAFAVSIEKETAPDVWAVLPDAPSTLYLPLKEVQGALRMGTEAEQREELLRLLRGRVRDLSVVQGDVAVDKIEALLPSGWPVTVDL